MSKTKWKLLKTTVFSSTSAANVNAQRETRKNTVFNNALLLDYKYDFGFGLFFCERCGAVGGLLLRREYPGQPVVGVGVVIAEGGRLVLVRRGASGTITFCFSFLPSRKMESWSLKAT